jgi:YaiO family outer membrane protein
VPLRRQPYEADKSTVRLRTIAFLLFCLTVAHAQRAAAQGSDLLASARNEATTGRRPAALARLAAHLETSPRDVDARLLYGAILSWEGRYDEARRELRQVLEQSPAYKDARIALMNIEWWSGNINEARDAADAILAEDPGDQRAREVRDRVDAASRPWWAGVSYSNDTFNGSREPWHEYSATLTRLTPRGSLTFRASEARRFGYDDRLIEVDFYPRFRPGTYAFLSVGGAPDSKLYPSHRVAFDLYQGVGGGFEVSGGFRRLAFSDTTNIYVGTLSKYLGNWMLTGKVFHVPGEGSLDSTSYHGGFRRYIRGDGESYVGLTYSHGSSREEIRNVADLATLDSDTIRGEVDQQFARRLRLYATGGTSRQERQFGTLWQTSVTGGFRVLF